MNWGKRKIGELCKIGRGSSPRPINDQRYFIDGNIPWVKIADATSSYRKIYRTKQYVNDFGASFSRKLPEGSLIIGTSGTLGLPMFLGVEGCIHDGWLYVSEFNGIDKYYLYYKLMQLKDYFYSKAYGVAIQNISTDILRETEINLPSLNIQEKISSILNSYDDLIENNLRRIELLEESARLLYLEWFVYLRFPGHEHTKITNGVPEGWKKKKLGEVIVLNYGKALKASDRKEGSFPVYGSSGIVGYHDKHLVKCPAIIVGRKGNVGSVYLSFKDFYPIDTVYFIESQHTNFFIFYNLKHQNFISSHAAVPGLNRDFAYSLPVILPSEILSKQFEEYLNPLYKQIQNLQEINEKLKMARDILLPRLMNGVIAV